MAICTPTRPIPSLDVLVLRGQGRAAAASLVPITLCSVAALAVAVVLLVGLGVGACCHRGDTLQDIRPTACRSRDLTPSVLLPDQTAQTSETSEWALGETRGHQGSGQGSPIQTT